MSYEVGSSCWKLAGVGKARRTSVACIARYGITNKDFIPQDAVNVHNAIYSQLVCSSL